MAVSLPWPQTLDLTSLVAVWNLGQSRDGCFSSSLGKGLESLGNQGGNSEFPWGFRMSTELARLHLGDQRPFRVSTEEGPLARENLAQLLCPRPQTFGLGTLAKSSLSTLNARQGHSVSLF